MKTLSWSSYQRLMSLNLSGLIALVQGYLKSLHLLSQTALRSSLKNVFQRDIFLVVGKKVRLIHFIKGGAKDEIYNYRPISILPILSNLLEKLFNKI